MDFYLIEKSYPQTREIANFGKIWPIIPPMKKPDLHPWPDMGIRSQMNTLQPTTWLNINFLNGKPIW